MKSASVWENVVAGIIVTGMSTVIGIVLKQFGLSTEVSISIALVLFVCALFALRWLYSITQRQMTVALLNYVLSIGDTETNKRKKELRTIVSKMITERYSNLFPHQLSPLFTSMREYENQQACENEIRDACKRAKVIKILTIRGERYFLGPNSLLKELCEAKVGRGYSMQILVLSPESGHITEQTAAMLDHPSASEIREKMRITLQYLEFAASQNSNFVVKTYDITPSFKLLMFDDIMFVSSFLGPKNDRNAKMLSMKRDANLIFAGLERYFDVLWTQTTATQ